MTIEVTYKYKMSADIECVDVLKNRSFNHVISKAERYNKDDIEDTWISQVTKIEPNGYRNTRCLTWGYREPRALIKVKESQPIKRSVWDDIYCISEEEEELLSNDKLEMWVEQWNS